jgi:hypothetical protein
MRWDCGGWDCVRGLRRFCRWARFVFCGGRSFLWRPSDSGGCVLFSDVGAVNVSSGQWRGGEIEIVRWRVE